MCKHFTEHYEPGIVEMHVVDNDPENELLATAGCSYGQRLVHRGVKLEVRGYATPEEADAELKRLIELREWKLRERWWQFWRPAFPR